MTWYPLAISDCYILRRPVFKDSRGTFCKLLETDDLPASFSGFQVKDAYNSCSHKNVLRGMHFQKPPNDHKKLVTISSGKALDVLVDLRKKDFGKVDFVEIDASQSFSTIAISEGVAHGFLSLSDFCILNYLTSSAHVKHDDCGVNWKSIQFQWPIKKPIVSERDQSLPNICTKDGLWPLK